MKILIDIGHPAHVHYFKNFIRIMAGRGHHFLIIAKKRNVTHQLLEAYGIPFITRSDYPKSLLSKLFKIPLTDMQILKHALKYKPDILMGFSGTHVSHVGRLINKPGIVFDDTDHAKMAHASYAPFASVILTPSCFTKDFGKKHIRFNGYMELCSLHPNYFSPDIRILKSLNINPGEKYAVLRFVSWTASHDLGHRGISRANKNAAVGEISKYAKIFITSETDVPQELEKYRLLVPPEKIHDVMAFAALFYGESATMASESAVLGVPSIYIDKVGRSYTFEEEKEYGLVFNFSESSDGQAKSIARAVHVLQSPKSREEFRIRRQRLIKEKIDVTSFMIWFIENYPESAHCLRRHPDYQKRFLACSGETPLN